MLASLAAPLAAQAPPAAVQIAQAVSPLPDSLRAGARVLGYRGNDLVTLREGSNQMVCLADEPGNDRFHVACYHQDLEPFMARGRELRAQGVTQRDRIDSIRRGEIESGRLPLPRHTMALYSLTGPADAWDARAGVPRGVRGLDVLYVPYATAESTGISVMPAPDRPWLMSPGEPWAHVMISRGR